MQQVADWLQKLGLGQYAQRFAENDISFATLPDLTGPPRLAASGARHGSPATRIFWNKPRIDFDRFGSRSDPELDFSRGAVAIRHSPSTKSSHFMVTTLSRRWPVS